MEIENCRIAAGPLCRHGRYIELLVGVLSLLLAPVVVGGNYLISYLRLDDRSGLRGSLSAHYHGRTGGLFVGILCSIGLLLGLYGWGRHKANKRGGPLILGMGFAAWGVALFPTPVGVAETGSGEWFVSMVHVLSATALFLGHAGVVLLIFRNEARQSVGRWFVICGSAILICVAAIPITSALGFGQVLLLQTVASTSIGVAWVVRSQTQSGRRHTSTFLRDSIF